MAVVPEAVWRTRQRAHAERVEAWTAPHLARRRLGQAHPVEDFLFTYYSHRPAQLRRWHPGSGEVLEGAGAAELGRDHSEVPRGARLDVETAVRRLLPTLEWVRALLHATGERPALLGCFGLHEWAMVYRQPADGLRHPHPLRLGTADTDAVVESLPVRCSHADAFRFFTPAARPLNVTEVTRDRQLELEQPGCLHAGMDLYKWTYKLGPLVASELVADAFELARDIRWLDMQASPYDLSAFDLEPVRIETAEGRGEYAERQRAFAERARPLRAAVLASCERWLTEPVDGARAPSHR
jgi:hypothetical protein